jgi:hypothetical protein
MRTDHSAIITIGCGIGGIAILIIVGLYVAGALVQQPVRWYLVGIASALVLLSGGLLVLSYARSVLDRIVSDQRHVQATVDRLERYVLVKIQKGVSDSEKALTKMNVGNSSLFQRFNRRLTNEDLKHFAGEWVPKLGLDLDAPALGYIAHHICLAEDACVGRLAGDIRDMLLRILIARSIKEPELNILEIGTLFGVSMAIAYENCRSFFRDVHVTVIDPLQGYYGKPLDPMTGIPVSRETFTQNMQRMHIPESDYTVIERLSTEDEALEQASKRHYNVLIIDGDHSYSGVRHDFLNYSHLVKPGGYIVFDNYNDPSCPGVLDFVNKEVVGSPNLEFVGASSITAVFRVITPQDMTKRGQKQRK